MEWGQHSSASHKISIAFIQQTCHSRTHFDKTAEFRQFHFWPCNGIFKFSNAIPGALMCWKATKYAYMVFQLLNSRPHPAMSSSNLNVLRWIFTLIRSHDSGNMMELMECRWSISQQNAFKSWSVQNDWRDVGRYCIARGVTQPPRPPSLRMDKTKKCFFAGSKQVFSFEMKSSTKHWFKGEVFYQIQVSYGSSCN